MSDQTKPVVEDTRTPQQFIEKYKKLCEEYAGLEFTAQDHADIYVLGCELTKHQIVVNPAFRARDDGTFSVVLQTSVGKMSTN